MIRYRGNDIIETIKVDGNNKEHLAIKKIHGRNEDYLICKDGTYIKRLGFIFKRTDHVNAAQLIQNEKGKVRIKIVPDPDFNKSDSQSIKESLWERVGKGNLIIDIELVSLNELEYTSSGKFKYIINNIN